MIQSLSFVIETQKKFRLLIERRKTRFSFICSTTHSGLWFIRLANLFFALLDFGVTKARSNMLEIAFNVYCTVSPTTTGFRLCHFHIWHRINLSKAKIGNNVIQTLSVVTNTVEHTLANT